jgi:hypothetical protein
MIIDVNRNKITFETVGKVVKVLNVEPFYLFINPLVIFHYYLYNRTIKHN